VRNILRFIPAIAVLLLVAGAAQAQTKQHNVVLAWTASTTSGVTYNVYRGTVSGGPYTKLNSSPISNLTYTDTTGTGGTAYFYVATAVDANGFESVFSNQVSATFLASPAPPTGLTATAN
jgi:fibronectin type 3 domain-containing protein